MRSCTLLKIQQCPVPKLLKQDAPHSGLCSTFLQSPPHSVLNPHPTVMHPLSPGPYSHHFLLPQSSFLRSLPPASFLMLCCGRHHAWVPAPSESEQITTVVQFFPCSLLTLLRAPMPRPVLMYLNCPQDWGHGMWDSLHTSP